MRLLALFLALTASVAAADLQIVRVFTGWRDAASFKRISEYFTGVENTSGQTVVRTKPDARAGYYFLVRTVNANAAYDAIVEIAVVLPESPRPHQFTFPVRVASGQALFNLGLTGTDWPNREVDAVAWQVTVRNAAGAVLATEKSYLWEKPPEA
ncbi:MAG: hypothetical protein Q8M02_03900 [Candidatus Didemnitutus sp.]|nr:hypothetical protein [Candidatus Didemnitutus sp.]